MRKTARAQVVVAIFLLVCAVRLCAGNHQPSQEGAQVAGKSGASATSAVVAPASDGSLLHVYRQRRYEGSALSPSIYMDDKQVARVGNGRRVTIKLSPGPHTVRSDDKSSAISLEAKAGQEFYVRIDEATGFWKGHGRLTLVLPEQGVAEFKLEKPIEGDRIVAKEMVAEE